MSQLIGSSVLIQPAAAVTVPEWATYANIKIDNLVALEFAGAESLAAAVLYGSASVNTAPGGGITLTAAGLVCNADTLIEAPSVDPDDMVIAVRVYHDSATYISSYIIGTTGSFSYGIRDQANTRVRWADTGGGIQTTAAGAWPSQSWVTIGWCAATGYLDGISQFAIVSSGEAVPMGIGGRYALAVGELFVGTISRVAIGNLKSGENAATVMAELDTLMDLE